MEDKDEMCPKSVALGSIPVDEPLDPLYSTVQDKRHLHNQIELPRIN